MNEPGIRPEAVDAAAAWLLANQAQYTRDALSASLRKAGYTDREIALAEERLALGAAGAGAGDATGRDLRPRAAAVLILGTLAIWAAAVAFFQVYGSQPGRGTYESASWLVPLAGLGLGVSAIVILVPSLLVVAVSDRLRRGAEGALVAILAIPFVLVVILAGLCVGPFVGK